MIVDSSHVMTVDLTAKVFRLFAQRAQDVLPIQAVATPHTHCAEWQLGREVPDCNVEATVPPHPCGRPPASTGVHSGVRARHSRSGPVPASRAHPLGRRDNDQGRGRHLLDRAQPRRRARRLRHVEGQGWSPRAPRQLPALRHRLGEPRRQAGDVARLQHRAERLARGCQVRPRQQLG